jgi:hypothetical protein
MIVERTRPTPNGPVPWLRRLPVAPAEALGVGADQPQAQQADILRRPWLARSLAARADRADRRARPGRSA